MTYIFPKNSLEVHLQDLIVTYKFCPLALAIQKYNIYDLNLLDTINFSQFLCDLEDLRALIQPSLRSEFYIESFGLQNHIETS